MYRIAVSQGYKKDLRRVVRAGRDIKKLERIIDLLARGERLPEKHKNHMLKGHLHGVYECHIEPDWLLMYEKHDDVLVLYLLRTGSHSNLFNL